MNHPDAYNTLGQPGTGDYRERGSKFFSYAYPCADEEALKAILQELKKLHPSARHFCYGAVLGTVHSEERSNDAGEPSGTAGLPILNQILSFDLKNVAVVVVRYFGGTKLGKSGLIKAYKESTQLAINQSNIKSELNRDFINIIYTYDATSSVMHQIEKHKYWRIEEQTFEAQCTIKLSVPQSEIGNALSSFDNEPGIEASSF